MSHDQDNKYNESNVILHNKYSNELVHFSMGINDSFAVAILSQDHMEINIMESKSVSRKVIIEGGFHNDFIDNMAAILTAEGKFSFFSSGEVSFPPDLI